MELDPSAKKAPRKVKFVPKAPPKREQKPALLKVEKEEYDIDVVQAEQLLRRHNEALRGKPKVERKGFFWFELCFCSRCCGRQYRRETYNVGELSKRAVITPDVDSVLDAMPS